MSVPEAKQQLVPEGSTLSPIDLEIITARLRAIADEADQALLKTAFSSAVRDGKDYSLVIADPQGRCIAMPTTCMPLFVTCMPRTIHLMTEMYPLESFRPGDILMTNDPWLGAGHKSDVALIAPVFKDAEVVAFVGTILHVADVGGVLGDFRAWDIYEEGPDAAALQALRGGSHQRGHRSDYPRQRARARDGPLVISTPCVPRLRSSRGACSPCLTLPPI